MPAVRSCAPSRTSRRGRRARRALAALVVSATATATVTAAVTGTVLAGEASAAPATPPSRQRLPQRAVLLAPPVLPPLPFVRAQTGSTPLLFLGDSLAEGWNATSPLTAFPYQAARALGQGGPVERQVLALAGYGVRALGAIAEVPRGTGLVVLELGTNDVPRGVDPVEFEADYRALTAKVRASAPSTALVCLGTWRPDGAVYDGLVRQACAVARGRYVPLADLYARPELRGTGSGPHYVGLLDRFHPNDDGYAVIAQRVVAAVR